MILADIVLLALLIGGGGSIFAALRFYIKNSSEKEKAALTAAEEALKSNDKRKIADVLALYGDTLPKNIKRHLDNREVELYLESLDK